MKNRGQQIVSAEQHWNMDPENKETCKGLGKEKRLRSVLCFVMGNPVPKLRKKEYGKENNLPNCIHNKQILRFIIPELIFCTLFFMFLLTSYTARFTISSWPNFYLNFFLHLYMP
jgi:hypothetical protein